MQSFILRIVAVKEKYLLLTRCFVPNIVIKSFFECHLSFLFKHWKLSKPLTSCNSLSLFTFLLLSSTAVNYSHPTNQSINTSHLSIKKLIPFLVSSLNMNKEQVPLSH